MIHDDLPSFYVFGPWPDKSILRLQTKRGDPTNDPTNLEWDPKSFKNWQAEAKHRMVHSEKQYFEQLRIARTRGWANMSEDYQQAVKKLGL
jgi:hypothetical protein